MLSEDLIRRKLKEGGVIGVTARANTGRVFQGGFYSESSVREYCKDFIVLPQADEEGFIELQGERYGTKTSLTQSLGVSYSLVNKRLESLSLRSIKGKNRQGKVCDFYPEPAVKDLLKDHLQPLPQADEEGFLMFEGRRYGTIFSLSRILTISETPIRPRLKSSSLRPIRGKAHLGNIHDFYPVEDAIALCADLLEPLPVADEEGFFILEGRRYGTVRSLARLLGMNDQPIAKRVKASSLKPVKGKSKMSKVRDYYLEEAIRDLCADLLEPLPVADEEGFFFFQGERYGTAHVLSGLFGISDVLITKRVKASAIRSVLGKNKGGKVFSFHNEAEVQALCADFIANKNK